MRIQSKIRNFSVRKSAGRKLFLAASVGCLLFLTGFLSVFLPRSMPALFADASYNRLCREIFRSELSGNTLTLHYTLKNPADYGIYEAEARLPVYSPESQALSQAALTDWLEELSAVDPENLSPENQYSYTLLTRYLTLQQSLSAFTCYEEPLSPGSGMQQTLPVLFSEYRFQRRKDIDNSLSLLSQTDSYVQGLLSYEREKADAGLFMSAESLDALVQGCETFLTEDAIDSGSHFLVESFTTRLTEFRDAYPELLSDDAFDYYYQENIRILKEDMMPAYRELAKEMTLLSETARQKGGLSDSGGASEKQRYYTLLIRKSTGSDRSVEEIQEMLYAQFDSLRRELLQLKKQGSSAAARHTHPLSAEDILAFLQQDMREDYPPLLSGSEVQGSGLLKKQLPAVTCDIKYISKSLSASSAPAFYLTPQMDSFHKNVIYINPDSSLEGTALFTTLAHEAFPGHLYQTVYARESGIADRKNPLRGILDYPGYAEGWALYAELASYDYAANYYAADTEILKTSRSLELCLCSLLDLHIHYYGFNLSQTQALLSMFGIPEESAQNIYTYIEQEPASYLKYYLSYLEILSLKEEAADLWGENYSDYRFHQFYLDAGPSDFVSLRERLHRDK